MYVGKQKKVSSLSSQKLKVIGWPSLEAAIPIGA